MVYVIVLLNGCAHTCTHTCIVHIFANTDIRCKMIMPNMLPYVLAIFMPNITCSYALSDAHDAANQTHHLTILTVLSFDSTISTINIHLYIECSYLLFYCVPCIATGVKTYLIVSTLILCAVVVRLSHF